MVRSSATPASTIAALIAQSVGLKRRDLSVACWRAGTLVGLLSLVS